MDIVKSNGKLKEKLIIKRMNNGMKCYIVPKKGCAEKQAAVCVRYGSVDGEFEADGVRHVMPRGTAHFLEHKMFEDESGELFNEFAKLGAEVNAFTNFYCTSYYFSCTENFNESLGLLLKLVSEPYITGENVEREKGIIAAEIRMYEDDPHYRLYFNLLKGIYGSHPLSEPIAGDIGSMNGITAEMLTECHRAFYTPENMAVICTGDVCVEDIFGMTDGTVRKRDVRVSRKRQGEPDGISREYITEKMETARPLFMIGFLDADSGTALPMRDVSSRILLDMLTGPGSGVYNRMYDGGLIDSNYGFDYLCGPGFGAGIIAGSSPEPERVLEAVKDAAGELKRSGIEGERFGRVKGKHIGNYIRGLNSTDAVNMRMSDCYCKDTDIVEMFERYTDIAAGETEERLPKLLDVDNMVLSVIE